MAQPGQAGREDGDGMHEQVERGCFPPAAALRGEPARHAVRAECAEGDTGKTKN